MSGQSGKGNSSAETKQTANNYQTATTSGIAVGGQGNSANISVVSSDPEVARTAITGNAYVTNSALGFAGRVADSSLGFASRAAEVAAATQEYAVGAIERTGALSIYSANDLAAKYAKNVSQDLAQNVNLLQSVGQQQTDVALNAQKLASQSLQQGFAIAAGAAPQTPAYLQEQISTGTNKTIIYVVIGLAAIFGLFLFTRKN